MVFFKLIFSVQRSNNWFTFILILTNFLRAQGSTTSILIFAIKLTRGPKGKKINVSKLCLKAVSMQL